MGGRIDSAAGVYGESTNSPEVSRNTPPAANAEEAKFQTQSQQEIVQSGEANVLNNYRNVTYNFTLAGLNKNYAKEPGKYQESELTLVIAKSGGKGYAGLTTNVEGIQNKVGETVEDIREGGRLLGQKRTPIYETSKEHSAVVQGFNQRSAGRFDMFIENVEIETLMSPSPNGGMSQPTKVKFDVIEPYSMNGFLEALHVAALAAGYPSYLQASFVLKIEFWGYPDDDVDEFKDPVKIPKSERYFPIGLTGIEVSITEKGTKYSVSAVPHNERAFGEPNLIKKPIKMAGIGVQSILENFMENLEKQVKESQKEGQTDQTDFDSYRIKFPVYDDKGDIKDGEVNDIGKAGLVEILKGNALYQMVDPGTSTKPDAYQSSPSNNRQAAQARSTPESYAYVPGKTVIQFPERMNAHDAITAVIRDSEYVKTLLKDIAQGKRIDDFGMVDYFMIRMEASNKEAINPTTQKPYQEFTYIVTPYKIHITKVPNYGSLKIDEAKYKKLSLREYNYIYTGQNTDVLNFKLDFNTLFFEAVPAAMGKQNVPNVKTTAGPDESAGPKNTGAATDSDAEQQTTPVAPVKTLAEATSVQYSGTPGGQPDSDPFAALAKNMHNAVINSKASMVQGEIEILGDPFFLVTGGMGNFVPKAAERQKTVTGEAIHHFGQVMVTINFRNPIDYNSFEDGGMMQFDPDKVPFSGIYQVINVINSFRDGMFKQRMNIIRMPGQIAGTNLRASDPKDKLKLEPLGDGVQTDTSRANAPSQRANDSSVQEQLGRGLPASDVNYTGSTGGLGGNDATRLVQTPGINAGLGRINTAPFPVGQPISGDPLSNIRLNSSGLAGLTQGSNLSTAALIAVAANVVTGNIPAKRAVGVVAGALAGAAIASAIKKPQPYSGIGEGATIPITNSIPTNPTGLETKFGETISSTSLPEGSVSSIAGTAQSLGATALGAVSNVGKSISGIVGGVSDSVSSLFGTKSDPQSVGAKAGIDTSLLSGLSPNLGSKSPTQIMAIAKATPENVDLVQATQQGLALDYLPASKVANIPPTMPFATAPLPVTDASVAYAQSVAQKQGVSGLENLYGVTSLNSVPGSFAPADALKSLLPTSSLPSVASVYNPVDANVYNDKLSTVQSQLSGVTGLPSINDAGVSGSVTSALGSITQSQSPLAKLVNKLTPAQNTPSDLNDFYG